MIASGDPWKKGRPMRSIFGFSGSHQCHFLVSLPSASQRVFPTSDGRAAPLAAQLPRTSLRLPGAAAENGSNGTATITATSTAGKTAAFVLDVQTQQVVLAGSMPPSLSMIPKSMNFG
jgi:hypothetical protein